MTGLLIHEWLEPTGGSENVFETLTEIFPDARQIALWNAARARFPHARETALGAKPFRGRKVAAVGLSPVAWRMLPRVDADWALISSHLFAHHASPRNDRGVMPKLVYAHTPARYVWEPDLDGRGRSRLARLVSGGLRPLDRARAAEAHGIAANSRFVAERIERTWHRDARVIYPPVAVNQIMADEDELTDAELSILGSLPEGFLLGASRFVPYKRLDLAIAAGKAAGRPVVLAGGGPEAPKLEARLRSELGSNGILLINPSTPLLRAIYRRAAALIFPPIEDFGIMPVEAMAAGTPCVVAAVGGASESVIPGVTGAHVRDWNSEQELREAVSLAVESTESDCMARAREFDTLRFEEQIRDFVEEVNA